MKDSKKVIRRHHSAELKGRVLGECAQPGASVASVAMLHGINANLVHKWRRLAVHHSKPVKAWLAEHVDEIEAFYLPSVSVQPTHP